MLTIGTNIGENMMLLSCMRSFYKGETNGDANIWAYFFVTNGICCEHSPSYCVMKSDDYITRVFYGYIDKRTQ